MLSISKTLYRLLAADTFIGWAVLTVFTLFLPVVVALNAYGMSYDMQIIAMLVMAISCALSMYFSLCLDKIRHYAPDQIDLAHDTSPAAEHSRAEFERYIRKINSLNYNPYIDADGTVKNLAYCRSSDHALTHHDYH